MSGNVRRVDGAEDSGMTAFGAESVPANVAGASTSGVSGNVRRVDGAEDSGMTAFGAESVPANVAGASTRRPGAALG